MDTSNITSLIKSLNCLIITKKKVILSALVINVFFRIIRLDWFCFIYYIHLGHTFLVALKARFHNENVYFFAKAIIDFILSGWHKLTCKIYFHNCFLLFQNKIKMSGYFFRIVKLFSVARKNIFLGKLKPIPLKTMRMTNETWNMSIQNHAVHST